MNTSGLSWTVAALFSPAEGGVCSTVSVSVQFSFSLGVAAEAGLCIGGSGFVREKTLLELVVVTKQFQEY